MPLQHWLCPGWDLRGRLQWHKDWVLCHRLNQGRLLGRRPESNFFYSYLGSNFFFFIKKIYIKGFFFYFRSWLKFFGPNSGSALGSTWTNQEAMDHVPAPDPSAGEPMIPLLKIPTPIAATGKISHSFAHFGDEETRQTRRWEKREPISLSSHPLCRWHNRND